MPRLRPAIDAVPVPGAVPESAASSSSADRSSSDAASVSGAGTRGVSGSRADAEEAGLIARVALGERDAFERLYHVYHPRLTRFLERMTRRPQLVGELLNDTMLVVWNRADRFNGASKVSTWIFAIAFRKARKALSRLDEPVDESLGVPSLACAPGADHEVDARELRALLRRALDELPAAQRAVVELTYFHGFDYREIADIVECPVDTVKTRMFHARRRLKAMIGGRLGDWL